MKKSPTNPLSNKLKLEKGASLVEYCLLVGLIATVCVIAVKTLGSSASNKLSDPVLTNALN